MQIGPVIEESGLMARERIQSTCKKHGPTDHFMNFKGCLECYQCRAECVTKHRRKKKEQSVELYGGKCQLCGYNKCLRALDFHHIDPTTKSFDISSKAASRSYESLKEEASKCYLLCKNCNT